MYADLVIARTIFAMALLARNELRQLSDCVYGYGIISLACYTLHNNSDEKSGEQRARAQSYFLCRVSAAIFNGAYLFLQ